MKPSYIILIETGERLNLSDAYEFNPNEYAWKDRLIGFCFSEKYPNESYCYKPDIDDPEEEPITATTILFKAYDEDNNLLCEDTDHVTGMWL